MTVEEKYKIESELIKERERLYKLLDINSKKLAEIRNKIIYQ